MEITPGALLAELAQCRDALAAAAAAAAAAAVQGEEPEGGLTPEMRLAFIITSIVLVLFAGMMAGLTLGLLSLDKVDLEVIKRSGTAREVWLVERVEPVLARPHFLLATLLLCNSAAMEALPLFLDRLLNPAAAIILSVSAILVFGEILPQAVCKRYGLQVGAYLAWFVSFLMLLTAAITWPIGKLLDAVLGEESALFKRRELKALVSIHADPTEDGEEEAALTLDEVQVIQGALDMASKTAESAMTPIDKVFLISSEAEVNDELLTRILERGHSRLPVYEGENQQNIVGLVLVKELLLVDEDAGVKIRDLRLRDLPFMSADTMLYDVLKVFRFGRSHMACLTRPAAASGRLEVVGVITIEDVLEELLQQEIVDETDQYVDNLQTMPTHALQTLQQLPPNLRHFLTHSLILPVSAAGVPSMPGMPSAAHVGAAAAGAAMAASSHGGSPRAVAAAAAAAATSAVLSPGRRGRALLATSLEGPERRRSEDAGAAVGAAAGAAGAAVARASSADSSSALLARDKPPIPRRTSSSRSLRGDTRRSGSKDRLSILPPISSDALHQPLLESDQEGETPGAARASELATAAAPTAARHLSTPEEWQQMRQQHMEAMLRPRGSAQDEPGAEALRSPGSEAEQSPGRQPGTHPQRHPPSPFHAAFVRSPTRQPPAPQRQQRQGDDGSDMV